MKLFIVCLILICCKTPQGVSQSKVLKEEIKNNWQFSVEKGYYLTNQKFIDKLDSVYGDYLLNSNKKEILELFGRPTKSFPLNVPIDSCHEFFYKTSLPYVRIPEGDTTYWEYKFQFNIESKLNWKGLEVLIGHKEY